MKEDHKDMITDLIAEGRELRSQVSRSIGTFVVEVSDDAVPLWQAKVRGTIRRLFGDDSIELTRWDNVAPSIRNNRAFSDEELAELANHLREQIAVLTELQFATPSPTPENISSPDSRPRVGPRTRVFIIHGHDERNLLRLKELLRDRFGVHPVVLMDQPGEGRTLIEKFESEAVTCEFAFALLTPDDQVVDGAGEYTQARPNVVFELGWFYGKLGRKRVVILMQQDTKIHSDLSGIEHYTFLSDVREQALKIEDELAQAGLVSRHRASNG